MRSTGYVSPAKDDAPTKIVALAVSYPDGYRVMLHGEPAPSGGIHKTAAGTEDGRSTLVVDQLAMTARIYHLSNGSRLLETGRPEAMYLTYDEQGRFALTDGSFIEPRLYVHMAETGEAIAYYARAPRTYALDDYFYILDIFYVLGDTLYAGGIEMGGPPGVYRCKLMMPNALLTGLRAMEP